MGPKAWAVTWPQKLIWRCQTPTRALCATAQGVWGSAYTKSVLMNLIGRAKRAPHWGVQSRFRVIYMFRTDAQLCPVTQPVVPLHNRPSRYPTGSDKQELGGDTLPAEILFTGEWCYPYLLGCAEDLGVWV